MLRNHISFPLFIIVSALLCATAGASTAADKQITVDNIYTEALNDSLPWQRLAYMTDTFGPRLSGSEGLDRATEWILRELRKEPFDSVYTDDLMLPNWKRGKEYCNMLVPRRAPIEMLGLGRSIGTDGKVIKAKVFVVRSFEELKENADKAKGKIVIYHQGFENYGQSVQYRVYGAIHAASCGAVASLTSSASSAHHYHPHTGSMRYNDTVRKIPHAAISYEDAAMLYRMQQRGQAPEIELYMEAKTYDDVPGHNIIAEIRGSEHPERIIALGGHLDCWDVGTGAHDDAAGCMLAWEVLKLYKELGLRPKCTVRMVMWANEENGVRGGRKYAEAHGDEEHILMAEFDSGIFHPISFRLTAEDSLWNATKAVEKYFTKHDSLTLEKHGGGVDISFIVRQNKLPAMSLGSDHQGHYFDYHHAATDTADKIDPEDYNKSIAAVASFLFLFSELY